MQFLYRLGAVILGVPAFVVVGVVVWLSLNSLLIPHHTLTYEQIREAAAARITSDPDFTLQDLQEFARTMKPNNVVAYQTSADMFLTALLSVVAATLATSVVVLTWRWVCGQTSQRNWWTHPRTPIERTVVRFVRDNLREENQAEETTSFTPQRRSPPHSVTITSRKLPPDDPIFREGYRVTGGKRSRDFGSRDQERRRYEEGEE